jgi:2-methylcitrate dehydratase
VIGGDSRDPDGVLVAIADYAAGGSVEPQAAVETALYCLMDSLACGFAALRDPACRKLLGPIVGGAIMSHGSRVPGTSYELDPVMGAFNIGAMVRWLDCNDRALAAGRGHPSDSFGAILAVADYLARKAHNEGRAPLTVRDLLEGMIKANEIQGVLALGTGFDRAGLDYGILVRVAATAVAAQLLGASRDQIVAAVSNAWLDGAALRTDAAGSRKSWAAADAASRGVRHALMAISGEMGCPSALSEPRWGFSDVLLAGAPITLSRPLGSHVTEKDCGATPFIAALVRNFASSVDQHFAAKQAALIQARFADRAQLMRTPVNEFMATLVKNS